VDYADAVAAFFVPRPEGTALPCPSPRAVPHAGCASRSSLRWRSARGGLRPPEPLGQLCIDADAFPPDILKRAAG